MSACAACGHEADAPEMRGPLAAGGPYHCADLDACGLRWAARQRATAPAGVVRWNEDKPHRCPHCHTVATDIKRPSSWMACECCTCGTLFARWPRLARWLPRAGVMCSVHRGAS